MAPRSSVPSRSAAAIRDIAIALPATVVETADLMRDVPPAQAELLVRYAGVLRHHAAAPDETALDLGEAACRRLFDRHPELPGQVDILVFCTQTPDHLLPPNSCALHGRLGLPDTVMAFDVPHACSAYLYALQLVHGLFAAGAGRTALVVTADTYSRLVHPRDRATRFLFGDGAAATWLTASEDGQEGIVDIACGTDGAGFNAFVVPAGGARLPMTDALREREEMDRSGNPRTAAHIHMQGRELLSFVGARIPGHVRALLARNDVALDAVDGFVFHQASAVVLDTLTAMLDLDPARVVRTIADVGNTVSASIPIALRLAADDGRIERGQLLLLSGFGAGFSWGSALLRW